MATPTIVGTITSAWNSVAGNTLTISKPAGVQDGDYLVAFLRSQSPSATTDWSSTGWARISTAFLASQTGPRLIGIYGLAVPSATALSATSFTFTFSGGTGRVIGAIAIVRNVDLTSPVVAVSTPYGGNTITNGSQVTTYADSAGTNSLALALYGGELVNGNTNAITVGSTPTRTLTTVYTNDTANDGTTGTSASRTTIAVVSYPGEATLPTVNVQWGTITGNGAQGIVLRGGNALPVASFTYSKTNLALSVDGSGSTDSDGTIASYAWDFGDTTTATSSTATHTYTSAGTYTVSLTVTDNSGGTNTTTQSVTVTTGAPGGIAVRSYTTLTAVGYVDTTATPGPSIVPPSDLAVGDYLVIGVFFAQGVGSGSVIIPSGFTQLTGNGTASNRLFVTYGRMMSTTADVSAVSGGVYLRAGYASTRIVAIAAALTGVSSFNAAGAIVYNNNAATTTSFSPPATGDASFYWVVTNSSSPSTSPAHTSIGGTKIVQAVSESSSASPYSDSQLSLMVGGTGANFDASVANNGSVGFSFNAMTQSSTPAPTRLGYSFTNPGTSNTTITLDPSTVTGGVALVTGNWMIAALALYTGTTTVTPPSGWTELQHPQAQGTLRFAVYGRIRQAGDSSYTFALDSNGLAGAGSLMWGDGGDPTVTNWVIGATGYRTVDKHNTAPALTTSIDHSLVLGLSFERTTATETGITSLTGANEWFYLPQYMSTQIETLDVSYVDDVSPAGTTSSMEWIYPNTQAINGAAVQISIPPAPNNNGISLGYPGVLRTSGGTNYNGRMFYWDGAAAHDFSTDVTNVFEPVTVTQFLSSAHSPWFAAHRGFSYSYPEETLYGYRGATDWRIKAIEVSVQKSASGTFWCFHDATTDRTTGVSGTISAMTDAQIGVLNNLGTTANNNTSQPARPTAKLVDVLDLYAKTHVIIIEDKTYSNTTNMLNLMDSYGTVGRPASEIFIWKVASSASKTTFFDPATARGYHRWAYIFDNSMSTEFPALPASGKADMIGMDFNSSDATLSSAIAICISNGVMPTGHIINSTTQRDRLLGLGMKGLMMSSKNAIPPWYNTW